MDLAINLGYLMKANNGGGRPGFTKEDKGKSFEEALAMVKEIGYKNSILIEKIAETLIRQEF